MLKKHKLLIVKSIVAVLAIISVIGLYLYSNPIRSVVNLLVISFIIAYTLKPLRNYLCYKFKLSAGRSSLIIILSFLVAFIGLLYCIVPAIIKESGNFGIMIDGIQSYIMNLATKFKFDKLSVFETVYFQIGEKINILLSSASSNLIDNMINAMENMISLAIVPITTYYLLSDSNLIYNKLLLIFPTDKRVLIKRINNNIDKILSRYIISQLVLSLIIGGLTFVLLIVLRIKFPLVLSLLNATANIIPYFGPIIGGVPIIFIALTGSVTKGILATIGVVIIQQIEGNLLAPKITGDSTNMHPVVIIILLVLGEKLGGIMGMILIVPVAVIIKVIYDDIDYYLF